MDNFRFWSLIDGARFTTHSQQEQIVNTRQLLSLLTDDELVDFHYKLHEVGAGLWSKLDDNIKYVTNCLGGRAPSDDGLEYFSYWCISCGSSRYDEVYKNPKVLLNRIGFEWEEFGSVAVDAYKIKHPNTNMDLYDFMDIKAAGVINVLNEMVIKPPSNMKTVKESVYKVSTIDVNVVAITVNNNGQVNQEVVIQRILNSFVVDRITIDFDKLQDLINVLSAAKLQLKKDFDASKEIK